MTKLADTVAAAASPDYWLEAAKHLAWSKAPKVSLESANAPFYQWFPDGEINTCYNAVDRHVEAGNGDRTALIFESGYTQTTKTYSYRELQAEVAKTAGMIQAQGVGKGDRVIIYMPMIPEAVMAMLACARIGAVHSVVFGGFAAQELAKRVDDAAPKLILTANYGLEPGKTIAYLPIVNAALDLASHEVDHVISYRREDRGTESALQPGRDLDWSDALAAAAPAACAALKSTDPLYILYTSGTTGVPKGVVRDNGGHATALLWSMINVYDVTPEDTFWAASDIGWVVGHSYIVYAPLLLGCTTLMYEGKPVGTPDSSAFWRIAERHKVSTLFTAPTAIRAIKKEDPQGATVEAFDLSALRALFLAGERSDPDTIVWSQSALNIPVIDHWWQTELGWPAIATCLGLGEDEIEIGSAGRAVPGYKIKVLDESHQAVGPNESGDVVLEMPLPPGCLPTLWNNPDGFLSSYLSAHPNHYLTGDAGFIDERGFIHIMSRTDDIINVAGHRLSTASIEQVISAHADIAECAVIGLPDATKGEVPVGLFVVNSGVDRDVSVLSAELIQDVRAQIGPVAAFKCAIQVAKLPKTRSGKTLRGTIRKIARGEPFAMPATIEDPTALDVVRAALAEL
ncbi:MAG: AMP-binding protein [Pseudomonadota bacterium]